MRRYGWLVGLLIIIVIGWFIFSPPRFWLNWTKHVQSTPEVGAQLIERYNCRECHRIDGVGTLKAPDLAGITQQADDPAQFTLRLWLRNPKAVKANTAMPNFRLSDSQIEAIVAYLDRLDQRK